VRGGRLRLHERLKVRGTCYIMSCNRFLVVLTNARPRLPSLARAIAARNGRVRSGGGRVRLQEGVKMQNVYCLMDSSFFLFALSNTPSSGLIKIKLRCRVGCGCGCGCGRRMELLLRV